MWKFITTLFFTTLVVLIWRFLNWAWFKPRKIERLLRKQGMKGNPYKFLIGDAKETSLMYQKSYSKPIGLSDDIAPRVMPNIVDQIQKYGSFSFSWSGPRPRIYITDPRIARDVLNKYRTYIKTFPSTNHVVKMLVGGLGSAEGDDWVKARTRFNPAFNLDKFKPMLHTIQSCSENTLNDWKKMEEEKGGPVVVEVFHCLQLLTSALLAQLMFSSSYTEEIKKTCSLLEELAAMGNLASKLISIPGEKYLPTKVNRRGKEIIKYVSAVFTSLITERLKKRAEGAEISGYRDLLDTVIEDLYDGKTRTESERQKIIQQSVIHMRQFFRAGSDTSSNLLAWVMILLSTHQEWQDRAREEVFQVIGNKKEITLEDLNKLKIITNIINETLRLYPPVMELSRLVDQETKINEYTIPKDSLVTFPVLMIQRDPEIWGPDAGEFRPDRFAEGVLKAANGEAALLPFGWGPRICIGMNFALIESKMFLATLLRTFSFELSPTYAHAPLVTITILPQYGAPVVLKRL